MDKAVMKVLFEARGLKTSAWMSVRRSDWRTSPARVKTAIETRLAYPLFVKPANLGSSIGISKVRGPKELGPALDLAAGFDSKIVVEAAVPEAREIECAVLGNDSPEASVPGEIMPSREFYDYEAKYLDNQSTFEIPAALPDAQAREVTRQAIVAFEAIDGSGLARVDFLLSRSTGELFINEINSMPGFTTISMYPKMWEASGVTYQSLVDRLITLALERHTAKQESKTSAF
jgi:D-alanine-D-alanine ligase